MTVAANTQAFDIAIVGGGMVGASLAVALSPLGLKVALVEAVAKAQGGRAGARNASDGGGDVWIALPRA